MPEQPFTELQLTRTRHHLMLRCNSSGAMLARRMQLSPGPWISPRLEQFLLQLMDLTGPICRSGAFYTGGIRRPYLFWFELGPEHFSLVGRPCSPAQAAQRFQPCTVPDFSLPEPCTAVLLQHSGDGYRPDGAHPLSCGERHLLRQCIRMDGPDFPEICFRHGGPVQWFRLWFHGIRAQCDKLYLLPLCAARRQVLLLRRTVSPEEMLANYCGLSLPENPTLTLQEGHVLKLAGQGFPNRTIAALLHRQEGTIKKQLSCAYAKLGIASRYDLLRRK